MKKRVISLLAVFFLLMSSFLNMTVSGAKTYNADAGKKYTFSGKVQKVRFGIANGSCHTGYVLYLDKKIKVKSEFWGKTTEKRVQFVVKSKSMQKKLKNSIGKKVKVKGKLIPGITSHYCANYGILNVKVL